MLSPDSFYYFFREHYGCPNTNDVIFYPKYHGAKQINEFIPYLHGEFKTQYFTQMSRSEKLKHGWILLYDQEPLMDLSHLVSTYQKKYFPDRICDDTDNLKIIKSWFQTLKNPIWCHSEKNSPEIDFLKSIGIIDCHYWYHGLISLNWFGYWKWCRDLDQMKKSADAKRFMIYARAFSGSRAYRKTLIDHLTPIRSQILYDWDQTKNIDSTYSATIDVSDAVNSYIHIVLETIFDTKKQHLTEKIFKPIVMSQPFIIASGPGSLEYVKSYGFKTFESVWDESYDKELDSDRRLSMIQDLIFRLQSLSDKEFQDLYQKIIPIIEHNRRWFYSDQFYARLIDELESNMSSAVALREERCKESPGFWFSGLEDLLERDFTLLENWDRAVYDYLKNLSDLELNKFKKFFPKLFEHINSVICQ